MHDTRWIVDAGLAGAAAGAALAVEHKALHHKLSDTDRYSLGVGTLLLAYSAWAVRHERSGRSLLALLIVTLLGGAATWAAFLFDNIRKQTEVQAAMQRIQTKVMAAIEEQAAWRARNN